MSVFVYVDVSCRDFGTKVISVKPLLKQLQTLLEDRDKTVREETKLLVVEIYRWIGPALKPQLTSVKPIQVFVLQSLVLFTCVWPIVFVMLASFVAILFC